MTPTQALAKAIIEAWQKSDWFEQNLDDEDIVRIPNMSPVAAVREMDYRICWGELGRTQEDTSWLEFDTENISCQDDYGFGDLVGFQELEDGRAFLGINCGGDWEMPIFYIVYLKDGELRAYIPREGNIYNKLANAAFGNHDNWQYDYSQKIGNGWKRIPLNVGKSDVEAVKHQYGIDINEGCEIHDQIYHNKIQPDYNAMLKEIAGVI